MILISNFIWKKYSNSKKTKYLGFVKLGGRYLNEIKVCKVSLFLADFRSFKPLHSTAAPCYTALLWSSSSAFTVYVVVVPSSSTSKVVPIIPRQSTSNCHRLNISGGIITSCVIFYFQCCLTHLRISEKIVKRDSRNSNRLAKWYTAYHREIIR